MADNPIPQVLLTKCVIRFMETDNTGCVCPLLR